MYQFKYAVGADGRWALTSRMPTAQEQREQPGLLTKYLQILRMQNTRTPANKLPMWLQIEMGQAQAAPADPTQAIPGSGQQTGGGAVPWSPSGARPQIDQFATPQQAANAIYAYWMGRQPDGSMSNDMRNMASQLSQVVAREVQPGTPMWTELQRDATWLQQASQGLRTLPTWYSNAVPVTTPGGAVVTQPGPQTGTPGSGVPTTPVTPTLPGSGGTPTLPPVATPEPPVTALPPTPTLPPVTTQPVPAPTPTPPTSTTPGLPPVTGTPAWPETPNTPQLPWIPEYPSGTGPNYPIYYPTVESNPNPWAGLSAEQMQRALAYYSGMLPWAELAEASRRYDTSQAWTQRAESAALTGRQQLPGTQRLRRFY